MLHRIRTSLTYANVMSTIAVFVALGGGAAYAANEWNGDNIQDETLTGADVQGSPPTLQQDFVDGTLDTWDIRNNSIFTVDIADESLGPQDINGLTGNELVGSAIEGRHVREGAIGGSHVANDSLDGNDIHSLNGSDVVDGGLSGDDLADGSVGAADLSPAARGFTETDRRRVTRAFPGGRTVVRVDCQEGWKATGGGYRFREPHWDIAIEFSEPTINGSGWNVAAIRRGTSRSSSNRLTAYVLCAR